MWTSSILAIVSLLLLNPNTRKNHSMLGLACVTVILSLWIDKGLSMVVTGFIPSPLGKVVSYWPTMVEGMIAIGIYSLGAFILTVLYKVATTALANEEPAPH